MTFFERIESLAGQIRGMWDQYWNRPNTYWLRPRPVPGSMPVTPTNALTYSAVFACMRVISETLAMLP